MLSFLFFPEVNMWEDLKPEEIIMGTDGLSSWVAEDKQKTPQNK